MIKTQLCSVCVLRIQSRKKKRSVFNLFHILLVLPLSTCGFFFTPFFSFCFSFIFLYQLNISFDILLFSLFFLLFSKINFFHLLFCSIASCVVLCYVYIFQCKNGYIIYYMISFLYCWCHFFFSLPFWLDYNPDWP